MIRPMVSKQVFVQQKAEQNVAHPDTRKVSWSRHAIAKLITENLSRQEVEKALTSCELVEDYPTGMRPLPDCLLLAWTAERQPVHSGVAIDEPNDRVFVITVYRPDSGRWEDDFRSRKK